MSWSPPPGAYGAADPLFLLLIALGVEAYLGGRAFRLRWLPNPRPAFAVALAGIEQRLNRPERGARALFVRGVLVTAGVVIAAVVVGWLVGWITRQYPFAWVLEIALLVMLLDQRVTWLRGVTVRGALATGSLVQAREALRPLVAEDLNPSAIEGLDQAAIVAASLAGLGRRFADRLVAPVFWYVLIGPAGLLLQQALLVASVALQRSGRFGEPAARAQRAVALIPRLLASVLLAAAALFVPAGRPLAGLRALRAPDRAAATVLAHAFTPATGLGRLDCALVAYAVASLINAGAIALLALIRLAL